MTDPMILGSGRSTVYAPRGVVATSQPLATSAGLRVLEEGGNAVDAAVAAAAMLNVTEPHMTGIGGDMFCLLWSAREARLVGLAAAGGAGFRMTREGLLGAGHEEMPATGAASVTVPGALGGWAALLERYGTRSLAAVLAPSVRTAEEGFPVTPIIARQWEASEALLARDAGASALFLDAAGRAPRAGAWHRNPDLAATLTAIGREGAAHLYGGELGETLARGVTRLGGFLDPEDLAAFRPEWVDPIALEYRGHRLYELPPPGQGVAALQMLALLDAHGAGHLPHNSAEHLHLLVEAKKLAYADLAAHVADPGAMEGEVGALLAPEYLAERAGRIDPAVTAGTPCPGAPFGGSDTVYLATADREGNMVSFINSIYARFGSGVVVPGTGFALQNRGAGFTLEQGHPNSVSPGKRPFHTIIPAFVTRRTPSGEEPWMAFGVMGGAMQPQGHVQVLMNLLDFGMDPQAAVEAPRARHVKDREIALEPGIGPGVREQLLALGHEVHAGEPEGGFGGAQLVVRLPRGWAAASDPRKDGHAAGH